MDVNADKDSLYILEEELFGISARVRIAGHCKWGLDARDCGYWNLYAGSPQYFSHSDREESETEPEVSLFLISHLRQR
jgi:hypothetical protein